MGSVLAKWWRLNLAIRLLSGSVAILIVCEIVLRLLGFGHPILYRATSAGYEIAANQQATRLFKTSTYNAQGLRGGPITPTPAPGTLRILSLGDSVANGGVLVNDNQTYEAQLQAKWISAGRKVEVLNASAGGWSSINEALWLREHGLYNSQLVMMEVDNGDVEQPFADGTILDKSTSFPSRYPKSAIVELLTRYIAPRLGLIDNSDPGSTSAGESAANTDKALAAVQDVFDYSQAHGARMVILYWSDLLPVIPSEIVGRDRLFAWANQHQIQVINLAAVLKAQPNPRQLLRDSGHPNAAGNLFIADYVATHVRFDDPQP